MMLTYSPAVPGDAAVLFQLNKQLIDAYEDTDTIDYDRVLNWVSHNIEENLTHFVRVWRDSRLVAYYCLMPSDGKWELDSLFVLPEFRGQGIGTAILRKCQQEAESALFLYVFRRNTGAVALYQKMGFRIVKEVGNTRYIMEYQNQGC